MPLFTDTSYRGGVNNTQKIGVEAVAFALHTRGTQAMILYTNVRARGPEAPRLKDVDSRA